MSAINFQEQFFKTEIDNIYHKSCGMIVYRKNGTKVEYLLLHEVNVNIWTFPKGHMEIGETELDTAIREAKEEAGIVSHIDKNFREKVSYKIAPVYEKDIILFITEYNGNVVVKEDEIDDYRWVDINEAKKMLPSKALADVLDKANFSELS